MSMIDRLQNIESISLRQCEQIVDMQAEIDRLESKVAAKKLMLDDCENECETLKAEIDDDDTFVNLGKCNDALDAAEADVKRLTVKADAEGKENVRLKEDFEWEREHSDVCTELVDECVAENTKHKAMVDAKETTLEAYEEDFERMVLEAHKAKAELVGARVLIHSFEHWHNRQFGTSIWGDKAQAYGVIRHKHGFRKTRRWSRKSKHISNPTRRARWASLRIPTL